MLCADRLMLGTANWGKEYRGHQVPVDEIKRILDYCQCSGIYWLDTAEAYECDDIIEKHVNSYFDIQYKTIEEAVPQWAVVLHLFSARHTIWRCHDGRALGNERALAEEYVQGQKMYRTR